MRRRVPSCKRRSEEYGENRRDTLGSCIARRILGGAHGIRHRLPDTLSVRPAGLSGVHPDCLSPAAIPLRLVGVPAHQLALRAPRNACRPGRRAHLHGPGVGPATASPAQDRSRPQTRGRSGGRRRCVAPEIGGRSRHAVRVKRSSPVLRVPFCRFARLC
jgi:hypothetical protein